MYDFPQKKFPMCHGTYSPIPDPSKNWSVKPLQPDLQDFFPGHAPQVSPDTLRLITGSTTTSADNTVGLLHLHNPHNTTNSTGGFI